MLCRDLQKYLEVARGLPFFYVVGDALYKTVLSELETVGVKVVHISDFCPQDDKYPDLDELVDFFRTSDVDYRDNRFVVVGLGEYLALRGLEYADDQLRRFKNTTLGNSRVVLLLRGVSSTATRIISEDARIREQLRAYIDTDVSTNITITNIVQDCNLALCKGVKQLLKKMESGATNNIMVNTKMLLTDSAISVNTLKTSYDVIRVLVPDIHFKCGNGSEENWNRLLTDLMDSSNDISNVFIKYGIDAYIHDSFYEAIAGAEYRNWLVYLYLQQNKDVNNSYVRLVLEKTEEYSELKGNLINTIVDYNHNDPHFMQLYIERKKLLKSFPEEEIAGFIRANEYDPVESIYRLTDNTNIERKTIVKWISTYGLSDAIEYVYPALHDYLKLYRFDESSISDELTEYFDLYKKQKVTNRLEPDFLKLVDEYAKTLIYAKLPTRNSAIMAIEDKNDAQLYWIDALGVEYLSYFVSLAKKHGLSIKIDVARCDLPTITSINKGFYDQWSGGKKYKDEDLDNIKHKEKGGYYFTNDEDPIHIVSELQVIDRAVSVASTELALHRCKSFIIASDHGASRLAVIKKQDIPYDTDTKGEHSGRCCKEFDGCDIDKSINENGYIVLSDYGRFRKSRAANVEVHGGATLEEIVVPIITLSLKRQQGVQIRLMNSDAIILKRGSGVEVSLYISDVSNKDAISIVVDGNRYHGSSADGKHFTFNLTDIKRARINPYTADVFDSSDLIGNVSFKVKGKTATMNEDFDFGTDF